MAFCNPKEELSALLCNIPSNWRDSIVKALTCILALNKDNDAFCDGVKGCETLTKFEPIQQSGNTLIFSYRDEKGVVYSRSIDITTVINNVLNNTNASCLMDQEDWEALTFTQKLAAIYAKACCVHGDCSGMGGGSGGSGCGCADCGDGEDGEEVPCIGTNACVCTQYIITGTAPYTFSYKHCTTKLLTEYEVLSSSPVYVCALKNSLILPLNTIWEEIGECGATTTTTTSTTTSTTSTSTSTTSTTTVEPTTTTTTTSTTTTSSTTTTTTIAATTTTTSSTTTTTTVEALEYYLADKYDCSDCSPIDFAILVALPAAHSVQVGKFYQPTIDDGFVYNIVDPDPQTPASATSLTTSNFTTCGGACA